MTLTAITDGGSPVRELTPYLERLLAAGIDSIQIREKLLEARDLLALCRSLRRLPNPFGTKLLVNGRVDVALAADLDGVHLPADAPPAHCVRALSPAGFQVGRSCHSIDDLRRAESEGADYAYLSPIFPSSSKPGYGPPLGLKTLEEASTAVAIPVLALGGVALENAAACRSAGAAGIAAISLFRTSSDVAALVRRLRRAA